MAEKKVTEEEVKAHVQLHKATAEYQEKKYKEAAEKFEREDA